MLRTICSLLLLPFAAALAAEPSLTIYNQNFAVVRGSVPLDLKEGVNQIHFADLTAQTDPSSVVLRDPAGANTFQVLEQNYRGTPIDQALMLAQFEGQTIDFLVHEPTKPDTTIAGKIIRSGTRRGSESQALIEVNGKLRFELPGVPLFPKLADNSVLKPELIWKIASEKPAKFAAEITYLTLGLNWGADYNVILPARGNSMQLPCLVTIDNQSGKDFENARTKLVAGDVNKAVPKTAPAPMEATTERTIVTGSYIPTPEKAFEDFHLYTLPRPVTLRDSESTQIELLRAADVPSEQRYVFDATGYDEGPLSFSSTPVLEENWGVEGEARVAVLRVVKNSEANHLGMPLPGGRWRFYRQDGDGQLEFVGEHEEPHTPKDETLRIFTGAAFDLTAKRRQTDFAVDRTKHTMDEAFEIKLRNHKTEPVELQVVEHLNRWQSWEIVEHSADFTKRDAHTIEFVVSLKPDEEKTLSYRARYTQLPANL
ncbi:MAG: DUF4139 domain-containing protein [Chthoniobacterales bacterium]